MVTGSKEFVVIAQGVLGVMSAKKIGMLSDHQGFFQGYMPGPKLLKKLVHVSLELQHILLHIFLDVKGQAGHADVACIFALDMLGLKQQQQHAQSIS